MSDLYFDVLDDLSDELLIPDFLHLLMINELTNELRYKAYRFAEYYICSNRLRIYKRPTYLVCCTGDLNVIKWFHSNFKWDAKMKVIMDWIIESGNSEAILWVSERTNDIASIKQAIKYFLDRGYYDECEILIKKLKNLSHKAS